jgi:uncharacterized protein YeaO (DUF488 family)
VNAVATDGASMGSRAVEVRGSITLEGGIVTKSSRDVRVRRAYDRAEDEDGKRVLVDRLWPRGMKKVDAHLDEWCKDVGPSTELRKWYGHEPAKFEEFSRRYLAELDDPARAEALDHLRELADGQRLTLLTATKNAEISEAAVLATILRS